ncbi:hypothetical protein Ae717Ps2_6624 [Pseudonocardia sp. Ae717_Ps2]|uniref:nuclease-related domain-containing protein n=1 Tax=Pseudonocardia sp. Ae717_Ps2 TaxID=1885573 RepID=UPI00094AB4BB|nr:nuclease-related domain-containing protein [Pseudonocardia sp. Ae717_Ps2]OLM28285.1 hypothetical protein Ae717Ps2_6624 [Pseudonocardia sp. Ae717_Ps2]
MSTHWPAPDDNDDGGGRHGGWVDLAATLPGAGVLHESTRRRRAQGAGADRSWRVGADGEAEVADLLAELTQVRGWSRLRGRRPGWRVLHSVPLGDGHGRIRGDIDHVLIGPPGVVTINTKHHRTGRLRLDGDDLTLNGRRTDYVPKARREASRAAALLQAALPASIRQISVRPFVVVVGGRLTARSYPPGASVVMTERLLHSLRALRPELDPDCVDALFDVARRSTTWDTAPPR